MGKFSSFLFWFQLLLRVEIFPFDQLEAKLLAYYSADQFVCFMHNTGNAKIMALFIADLYNHSSIFSFSNMQVPLVTRPLTFSN